MYKLFQTEIAAQLYTSGRISVLSGPFAGMKHFNRTSWGSLTPKWIGTYERELHDIVEVACQKKYASIINLGSADGYYSVGLALRIPSASVFAFDSSIFSQRNTRRLAALNGVGSRVTVAGACGPAQLNEVIRAPALVVCDVEGAEVSLLDPVFAPRLSECDILVELHEPNFIHGIDERAARPIEKLIVGRFPRHRVTIARALTTGPAASCLLGLPEKVRERCVDEERPPGQNWAWLERVA